MFGCLFFSPDIANLPWFNHGGAPRKIAVGVKEHSPLFHFLLLSITWTLHFSAAQGFCSSKQRQKNPKNPSKLVSGRLHFQGDMTSTHRKRIMHMMSLCRHLLRNVSQKCSLVIFK